MPQDASLNYKYRLLKIEKPGDKTRDVEDAINDMADRGWEVVGYSANVARGISVPTYSHLVLFRRDAALSEDEVIVCPKCGVSLKPPEHATTVKCSACGGSFMLSRERG